MKVCPVCGKEYSDTSTLCSVDAAVLKSADDPLLGQTLAEKYLIEELIKRGGMGAVYRGRHVLMDKTVAIKVLRPSLAGDDEVVARFSREAKAASRISHPHAVNVTDFGESENGVVFLVMEYLDGRTLKETIKSEGPIAPERVVEIVRQVTGALDAAHQQGVVHRDLKSDNIMLSLTNGGDWAKVLDFGIAKIMAPEGGRDIDITSPNLVVGTPQYMSPEQCSQATSIDARSDVYSLGVIVYEMLSGQLPFMGESATAIMIKQVQDQPPSILSARPELPKAIEAVVNKALAKQPVDRFQTAGEFSTALAGAVQGDAAAANVQMSAPQTTPNVPVQADDVDEETVVRPREHLTGVGSRQEIPIAAARENERTALANLNPWRVMVIGVVAMAVVFGAVFLLTRGSGQTTSQTNEQGTGTGLAADPNSQPVQPMPPPTGESEHGIQSQPGASPLATASPEVRNTNSNSGQTVLPTNTSGNFGNEPSPTATKTSSPRESPSPRPSPSAREESTPPPPKPSPTIKTVTKQTPTPPTK
jgi:eukaryotic-like serine/threonine-protein kinase